MSKAKATAYIDTIFGYAIPRLVRANNLITNCTTSINEVVKTESTIFPNPANDKVSAKAVSKNAIINEITIIDSKGVLVKKITSINAVDYSVNISDLAIGLYAMHIKTNKGNSIQKLIVE